MSAASQQQQLEVEHRDRHARQVPRLFESVHHQKLVRLQPTVTVAASQSRLCRCSCYNGHQLRPTRGSMTAIRTVLAHCSIQRVPDHQLQAPSRVCISRTVRHANNSAYARGKLQGRQATDTRQQDACLEDAHNLEAAASRQSIDERTTTPTCRPNARTAALLLARRLAAV